MCGAGMATARLAETTPEPPEKRRNAEIVIARLDDV